MPWHARKSSGQTGHCHELCKRARPRAKSRAQQQNNKGSFLNSFPSHTTFKNAKINDTGVSWANHWMLELLPSKTWNVKTLLTTCHHESRTCWLQQTLQTLIWGTCASTSSKWSCSQRGREDHRCCLPKAKLESTRQPQSHEPTHWWTNCAKWSCTSAND